ncbi:hypothetical protein D3C76_1864430 [compost metagenome]
MLGVFSLLRQSCLYRFKTLGIDPVFQDRPDHSQSFRRFSTGKMRIIDMLNNRAAGV